MVITTLMKCTISERWMQPLILSDIISVYVHFTATCTTGKEVERSYDEYDVSDRLKEHGWVLPAYTMAPNAKHVKLLRAVIR